MAGEAAREILLQHWYGQGKCGVATVTQNTVACINDALVIQSWGYKIPFTSKHAFYRAHIYSAQISGQLRGRASRSMPPRHVRKEAHPPGRSQPFFCAGATHDARCFSLGFYLTEKGTGQMRVTGRSQTIEAEV